MTVVTGRILANGDKRFHVALVKDNTLIGWFSPARKDASEKRVWKAWKTTKDRIEQAWTDTGCGGVCRVPTIKN